MKEIKLRTPCKCHNGHAGFLHYSVRFGEVKFDKTDKNRGWKRTCDCPTGGLGEGYEVCGEDELWTGLTDKHGVPVFEGDIVRTTTGQIRVIVFRDGAFHSQVPGWEPGKDMPTHPVYFWMIGLGGIGRNHCLPEVIGNVHEKDEISKEHSNPCNGCKHEGSWDCVSRTGTNIKEECFESPSNLHLPKLTCQRDFVMEDGTCVVAFRAGREYEWRWATREEAVELGMDAGPLYVFVSELGAEHFMSYGDVEAAFA